jgi:acyl-CoA thioester hydrolase
MDHYNGTYETRWADLDANGHLNYASYVDATGDLRFRFFTEHGFPPAIFTRMGVGPIFTSLKVQFLREVLYGETVTITFELAGLSPSGTRWRARHDVLKANGKKAAIVEIEGTILDLASRRPVAPSPELLAVFHDIPRSQDFEALPDGR